MKKQKLFWPDIIADPDSMYYQEDYVKGDAALSAFNHDAYVNELNRRKAKGVKHEKD